MPLKCLQFRQVRTLLGHFAILLCIAFISNSSFASPNLCRSLFMENKALRDVENRLGRQLKISLNDPSPDSKSPVKRFKLALKPATEGGSLGVMIFRYDSNENTLHVDNITVYSEYKRNGVSLALLEEAVKINPDTKVITSSLSTENEEIFLNALSQGLSPLDSVQETPAYKIRKALGFSEIINFDGSDVFSVRKPTE